MPPDAKETAEAAEKSAPSKTVSKPQLRPDKAVGPTQLSRAAGSPSTLRPPKHEQAGIRGVEWTLRFRKGTFLFVFASSSPTMSSLGEKSRFIWTVTRRFRALHDRS